MTNRQDSKHENQDKNQELNELEDKAAQSRRDFLRKSKYAAYATPLMTGLIIKSAAAQSSGCVGDGDCSTTGFN